MKSICFPPSAFSLLLTALSPRIRVLSRLQENKSMPMGEQIRDEINAPPRYDSQLQTRPALENDRGDLPDERHRNYGTTFIC